MYTRDIAFEDLDGNPVTQSYSFHMTEAEAAEAQFSRKGGIDAFARRIIETEDYLELIELFKELILKTYGLRDGQRFVKNQDNTDAFVQTGAYSALFVELATNEKKAIEFFKGIFPKSMSKQVEQEIGERTYTDQELLTVTWDEFYKSAGGKNDSNWDKRHMLAAFRRKTAV